MQTHTLIYTLTQNTHTDTHIKHSHKHSHKHTNTHTRLIYTICRTLYRSIQSLPLLTTCPVRKDSRAHHVPQPPPMSSLNPGSQGLPCPSSTNQRGGQSVTSPNQPQATNPGPPQPGTSLPPGQQPRKQPRPASRGCRVRDDQPHDRNHPSTSASLLKELPFHVPGVQ